MPRGRTAAPCRGYVFSLPTSYRLPRALMHCARVFLFQSGAHSIVAVYREFKDCGDQLPPQSPPSMWNSAVGAELTANVARSIFEVVAIRL